MKKIAFILSVILGLSVTHTLNALTISPAKVDIKADPGQTIIGEVELFNEQNEVKTFYASYENFESRGDSGAPYFVGAEDGLATWITTVPQISIKPGERKIIQYTVTIPENTKPGGYFAAIFFGTQPRQSTAGGEVSIGGKIGVLLLLRVSGQVDETAGLSSFTTKNENRFFTRLPIQFEYSFNNAGGDRAVPRGLVKIKNSLRFTTEEINANVRLGSVLPSSTRRFDIMWGEQQSEQSNVDPGFFKIAWLQLKNFSFGWYTAELELTWGESNQTAQASYNFFVIPWQMLTILIVILGSCGIIGRIAIKKYNNYIIAQATRIQAQQVPDSRLHE